MDINYLDIVDVLKLLVEVCAPKNNNEISYDASCVSASGCRRLATDQRAGPLPKCFGIRYAQVPNLA